MSNAFGKPPVLLLISPGAYAPKFERSMERSGTLELMQSGDFRYGTELDLLGRRQRVEVKHRGGFPDFWSFETRPSEVGSVESEGSGFPKRGAVAQSKLRGGNSS